MQQAVYGNSAEPDLLSGSKNNKITELVSRRGLFAASGAVAIATIAPAIAGDEVPERLRPEGEDRPFWESVAQVKHLRARFEAEEDEAQWAVHMEAVRRAEHAMLGHPISTVCALLVKMELMKDDLDREYLSGASTYDVLIWNAERLAAKEYFA